MAVDYREEARRRAAARYAGLLGRQDEMSAIPQNSLLGSVSRGFESVRDFGNKATVPDFIPLFGGSGVGDMIVGQTPEEIENWSYGNSPFDMPYQGTGGLLPRIKPNRQTSLADTLFLGADLAGAGAVAKPLAKSAIKGATPKAQEMFENTMRKTGLLSDAAPSGPRSVADYEFDTRYGGGTQIGEEKVKNLRYQTEQIGDLSENVNDTISIVDLANAGTPFISPMADRSETAQLITNFKGMKLSRPVHLQGGQDYGFQMEGNVYANAPEVSNKLMEYGKYLKNKFGVDPVLMPHTMTPSGSDFATFSAELQMSYAYETLEAAGKKRLDDLIRNKGFDVKVTKDIKGKFKANGDPQTESVMKNFRIDDWAGINDPKSIEQMRKAPAELRKAIVTRLGAKQTKTNMDTAFGSDLLSAAEIRAGVSDMDQLNSIDGAFRNVGVMDLAGKVTPSDHFSYPTDLPGEMIARLLERNLTAYDIVNLQTAGSKKSGFGMPWERQAVGRKDGSIVDPNNLLPTDQRALNLNMVGGQLNENSLRYLENQGLLSKF